MALPATTTAATPQDTSLVEPARQSPPRQPSARPGARPGTTSGDGLAGVLYRSSLWQRLMLAGPAPTRLLVPLAWSWPADAIAAEALLDGAFLHAGQRYPMRRQPWQAVADRPDAAAALHRCGWLFDLGAHGGRTGVLLARALIDDWIAANRRWSLPAWRPDVLASRLAAWLVAARFLLEEAEDGFAARFLNAAAIQARHLARVGRSSPPAATVTVAQARLLAALALGIGDAEAAAAAFVAAVDRQILSDGGPVQRAPALLLQVLREAVEGRDALIAAGRPAALALTAAIGRMVPALCGFRLGNGCLAAFNGGDGADPERITAVISRAGVPPQPQAEYPATGFHRLAAGPVVVVVDTGTSPAAGAATPAGLFSFAMSAGPEVLVVDAAACAVAAAGWGSAAVNVERREAAGAIWLDLGHDGWRRRFGLVHRRRLYLAATGADLRGEDTLERVGQGRVRRGGGAGNPFQIRFHLHPEVTASLLPDGQSVLLRTRSGSGWRFQASGAALALADGLPSGDGGPARRSGQIVVSGEAGAAGATVRWAFRQDGAR